MYQKAGGQRRWKPLPTYKDADNPPPRLQGPSPTPQNTHSKTQRPLQRLPRPQPKSPRNPKPRLRTLIRRRDRNKLPTQKNQKRRNTNHGKARQPPYSKDSTSSDVIAARDMQSCYSNMGYCNLLCELYVPKFLYILLSICDICRQMIPWQS
jgi:hypothetical protein